MQKIERARVVRDAVVAMDDRVEWTKGVVDGVEHPCWYVSGDGWHATITNLWDFHVASSQASRAVLNERSNVIYHEMLEVYRGEEIVMSFIYEIGGGYEQLCDFAEDGWEAALLREAPVELRKVA